MPAIRRIFFAASIITLGVLGLATGDFVAFWQPVPRGVPARETLAYVCAIICLVSGVALLWQRTAARAARVLLVSFASWMLLFRLPIIFHAPTAAVSYESWGECAVMLAGAWVLYAGSAVDWDRRHVGFATGDRGVRIARWFFGLALIAFGVAHFAYVKDTAALVPAWLPAHAAWVYITGCAYVAASLAVLSGVWSRPAAVASTLQMGLFTALIWLPIVLAGHADASQWSELLDSWALTVGAWVVAGSYRKTAPLAARRRLIRWSIMAGRGVRPVRATAMKRREAIKAVLAGASLLSTRAIWAAGAAAGYPAGRYAKAIVIDGCGGPGGSDPTAADDAPLSERDLQDVRQSGVTAVNLTVNDVGNGPNKFELTVKAIASADRELNDHPDVFLKVLRGSDITLARQTQRLGLIYGFPGYQHARWRPGSPGRLPQSRTADLATDIQPPQSHGRRLPGGGRWGPESARV